MKHIKTVAALLVAILLSTATLFAQTNWSNTDSTWFRHYSVGVSAGTDGVGVSAAVLLGNHLQLRGGYAWFPKTEIKSNPMIDMTSPWDIHEKVPVTYFHESRGAKVFLDFFPSQYSKAHFTIGLMNANGAATSGAYTPEPLPIAQEEMGTTGFNTGSNLITTDPNGRMQAYIDIANLRPYIGFGSGWQCSVRKRVSFTFDLGLLYIGSIRTYSFDWNKGTGYPEEVEITSELLEGKDLDLFFNPKKGLLDIFRSLPVIPHMEFTVSVRLF